MNKFKMTLIASSVVASLSAFTMPTYAADAPAVSVSGSAAIVSDYRYRGMSQTYKKPAVQVGVDLGLPAGFYAGFWGSSISNDALFNTSLVGLESDFFGGYTYTVNDDLSFDAGVLYVYYPTTTGNSGINTTELHIAASYKWLTAQYNINTSKYYGMYDSKGTSYIQLDAHYPLTDKLTLDAHVGHQMFKGSQLDGTSNSDNNYTDWSLGATYSLPQDWAVSLAYVDSNVKESFDTATASDGSTKFLGDATAVLSVTKSF